MALSDETITFVLKARDEASNALRAFSAEFDAMAARAEESSNRVGAAMSRMRQDFNEISTASSNVDRISQDLDRVGASAETSSTRVNRSFKDMENSSGAASSSFNRIRSDLDSVSTSSDRTGNSVSYSAGRIGQAAQEASSRWTGMSRDVDSASTRVVHSTNSIGDSSTSNSNRVASALRDISTHLHGTAGDAETTGTRTESAFSRMRNAIENSVNSYRNFSNASHDSTTKASSDVGALDVLIGTAMFKATTAAGAFASFAAFSAIWASAAALSIGIVAAGLTAFAALAVVTNAQVKASFTDLKNHVWSETQQMAQVMVPPVIGAIHSLGAAFDGLKPQIQQIFQAAAHYVQPLTDGLIRLVQGVMPGFVAVMQQATPVVNALRDGLGTLGNSLGQFFTILASSSGAVGSILNSLFSIIGNLVVNLGVLLKALMDLAAPILSALTPAFNTLVNILATSLAGAIHAVAPILMQLAQIFGGTLMQVLIPLKQPLSDLIQAIGNLLVTALHGVSPLLKDLAKIFGDLTKSIGSTLINTLKDMANALNSIVKPISDAIQKWPALRKIIEGIIIAFVAWKVATMALAVAQGILNAIEMMNPYVAIAVAVVALIVVLVMLEQKFHFIETAARAIRDFFTGPFMQAVHTVADFFTGPFMQAVRTVGDFFTGPFMGAVRAVGDFFSGPFIDFFRNAASTVSNVVQTLWHDVANFFQNMWHDISDAVQNAWHDVVNFFTNLWNDAKNIASNIWHDVANFFTNLWNDGKNIWNNLWNDVKNIFTNLWNDAKNIANNLWNDVKNFFTNLWNDAKNIWNNLWNDVKNIFTHLWDDAKNIANNLWNDLKNIFTHLWDDIKNIFTNLWNDAKNIATNLWHDVGNIITNLWHDFVNYFKNMFNETNPLMQNFLSAAVHWAEDTWHRVSNAFNNLKNAIIQIFKDIANFAFVDPVNFIIQHVINDGIDGILHRIDKAIGTHLAFPELGTLPRFATGGVVPGYEPGNDSVLARLSPGEGVLVPEVVQMLGGESGIAAINSMAPRLGGKAPEKAAVGEDGVQEASLGGVISSLWDKATSAVGGAIDSAIQWIRGKLADAVSAVLDHVIYPLVDNIGWPDSIMKTVAQSGTHKIGDSLLDWVRGQDKKDQAAALAYNASAGVKQWDPQILQVLGMLGQPASYLGNVEYRMNMESGGNPNAVNLTDSNAQAGHPSVGLMQVIAGTYAAYKGPDNPPYMYGVSIEPVSNIYAGLNYGLHRYGGMGFLTQPGGYDSGGWLLPGMTMAMNMTGRREMVLPPFMSEMLSSMHDAFAVHGGHHGDEDDESPISAIRRRFRGGHRDNDWFRDLMHGGGDWLEDLLGGLFGHRRHHRHHGDGDHDWDDWPWWHHRHHRHHPTILDRFLSPNHAAALTGAQQIIGDRSMLSALGLAPGGHSPFSGVFLNTNFGSQGLGNAYEANRLTWGTRSWEGHGNRQTSGQFYDPGDELMNSFVGGLFGQSTGYGGHRPWPGWDRAREEHERRGDFYMDFRGSQIMSDYDMDILMQKLSRRLANWGFPSAGVRIRR